MLIEHLDKITVGAVFSVSAYMGLEAYEASQNAEIDKEDKCKYHLNVDLVANSNAQLGPDEQHLKQPAPELIKSKRYNIKSDLINAWGGHPVADS